LYSTNFRRKAVTVMAGLSNSTEMDNISVPIYKSKVERMVVHTPTITYIRNFLLKKRRVGTSITRY
jgi:hypothetical protein